MIFIPQRNNYRLNSFVISETTSKPSTNFVKFRRFYDGNAPEIALGPVHSEGVDALGAHLLASRRAQDSIAAHGQESGDAAEDDTDAKQDAG